MQKSIKILGDKLLPQTDWSIQIGHSMIAVIQCDILETFTPILNVLGVL